MKLSHLFCINIVFHQNFNMIIDTTKAIITQIFFNIDYICISILIFVKLLFTLTILFIFIKTFLTNFIEKHKIIQEEKIGLINRFLFFLDFIKYNFFKIFQFWFLVCIVSFLIRWNFSIIIPFEIIPFEIVNKSLYIKYIVLILSLPYIYYIRNFYIIKIIKKKEIESKDWNIFNTYVVNNITVYKIFYVSIACLVNYIFFSNINLFSLKYVCVVLGLFFSIILVCYLYIKLSASDYYYLQSNSGIGLPIASLIAGLAEVGSETSDTNIIDPQTDEKIQNFREVVHKDIIHSNSSTKNYLNREVVQKGLPSTHLLTIPNKFIKQDVDLRTSVILNKCSAQWDLVKKGEKVDSILYNVFKHENKYQGGVFLLKDKGSLIFNNINQGKIIYVSIADKNFWMKKLHPSFYYGKGCKGVIGDLNNLNICIPANISNIQAVIISTPINEIQRPINSQYPLMEVWRVSPHYVDITSKYGDENSYYKWNRSFTYTKSMIRTIKVNINDIRDGIKQEWEDELVNAYFNRHISQYINRFKKEDNQSAAGNLFPYVCDRGGYPNQFSTNNKETLKQQWGKPLSCSLVGYHPEGSDYAKRIKILHEDLPNKTNFLKFDPKEHIFMNRQRINWLNTKPSLYELTPNDFLINFKMLNFEIIRVNRHNDKLYSILDPAQKVKIGELSMYKETFHIFESGDEYFLRKFFDMNIIPYDNKYLCKTNK